MNPALPYDAVPSTLQSDGDQLCRLSLTQARGLARSDFSNVQFRIAQTCKEGSRNEFFHCLLNQLKGTEGGTGDRISLRGPGSGEIEYRH